MSHDEVSSKEIKIARRVFVELVVVCLGAPAGMFGCWFLFKVGWDMGSGTPVGFFWWGYRST